MAKCLFCGNDLIQTSGKRAKKFCNSSCRSNFWYGRNKKQKTTIETVTQPEEHKLTDSAVNQSIDKSRSFLMNDIRKKKLGF